MSVGLYVSACLFVSVSLSLEVEAVCVGVCDCVNFSVCVSVHLSRIENSVGKEIAIVILKSRFWNDKLDFRNKNIDYESNLDFSRYLDFESNLDFENKISILKGKSRFWKNLDLVNKTRLSYLGHRSKI